MATKKAKRSVHPSKAVKPKHKKRTKAAPRTNRGASTRHPDRGGRSAERRTSKRSSAAHLDRKSSPAPGEFALREKTLPGRHFVEFPLVKGKVIERVQYFTTTNSNSLTIELQDHTSLVLDIDPGFTIHAQLMRLEKGELETLAEWLPIKNVSNRS